MNSSSSSHIPSLDALRAIAAISVVIEHIESVKNDMGILNFYRRAIGSTGVILFFVISGYLITYLLLKEQKKSGGINIKKFYVRRVLRIWPLYYLVLLLSVVVFKYRPDATTSILYLLFLPNVGWALNLYWTLCPQLWSIGVEEQFYLFWPWLVKKFKHQLHLVMLGIIIVFTFLLPVVSHSMRIFHYTNTSLLLPIETFVRLTKFNCLAIGGLLAFYQVNNYKFLNIFRSKLFGIVFIPLVFYIWFAGLNCYDDFIRAFLFTLVLANVTQNNYFIFNNRILNSVGKISYGIYMYHWFIIWLTMRALGGNFGSILKGYPIWGSVLVYLIVVVLAIAVSFISYNVIERYFLTLKKKFEIISTGNENS